jgi:hypothetical protein
VTYATPRKIISNRDNGLVMGALLKIVKNEMKTTSAKARSVPVFKVNPDFFSDSIEAIIASGFLMKT